MQSLHELPVGTQSVQRHLAHAGSSLVLADLDRGKAEALADEIGAEVVAADEILEVECDVFSPNARGPVLTEATVPRLRCRHVIGAANGQLGDEKASSLLEARGIRHVPEELAGSGWILGLIAHSGVRPKPPD